ARPAVAARLVRDAGRGLETPGGSETPGYLVRAGQRVQVGTEAPLPIVATQYDGLGRSLDVSLGEPSRTDPVVSVVAPIQESRRCQMFRLDLLTGAKLRWF